MPVTTRQPVGREEELEAVARLLRSPGLLPAVAVLPGEAGIGKTTLWLAAIESASARGYRVVSARPSEAEARFSFAGLTDLLGDAAGDVLPGLPPIQRRALEAALLLGDSESHADERAVAAAFLGALRLLAAESPLCLAIDDVQWLDAASLATLRYALARLDHEPVVALVAVRGSAPEWLRRALPEEGLRTIAVGGLSVGATHELLRTRLGAMLSRPTLIKIWETSGGNPFFALELAGALQRRGGILAAGEDLPVPSTLDELLHARLDSLRAPALEVARVVAALADPTLSLVETAVGRRFDEALAETLTAKILELDDENLRFTHPLLRSAVSARQLPDRRRSLHARLADIVPTSEERARHLALATIEPDREIASTLEDAARSAQARGAPATAAELAEQALALTPRADAGDASRRLFLAADRHNIAGDTARAIALLERARAEAGAGVERAAILVQLGDLMFYAEPREAEALYQQALAEATGDDALDATIHLSLADNMRWGAGIDGGLAHATLAVEAASRTEDVALRCRALSQRADWRFRAGGGIQHAEMDEALALERALAGWPLVSGPTEQFCHELVWAVELDTARTLLLELLGVRRAQSDPGSEAWVLWTLSFLEWRAGNWDEADRYATEFLDFKMQLGGLSHGDEFPASIIAAHRGKIADAPRRTGRSPEAAPPGSRSKSRDTPGCSASSSSR